MGFRSADPKVDHRDGEPAHRLESSHVDSHLDVDRTFDSAAGRRISRRPGYALGSHEVCPPIKQQPDSTPASAALRAACKQATEKDSV
jgi:hypothetical protein